MKIIGLMLTWNNLEFFKHSLEQALDFCDELILVEGCHSRHYPKHSTDGTCEHIETIRKSPKLVIQDFEYNERRYNLIQHRIRQEFPKLSALYKPGNWIVPWDDDMFYFNDTLPKIRAAMQNAKNDSLRWQERHFIYNFRFCTKARDIGCYRIVNGSYLHGMNTPCYPDGRHFKPDEVEGIELFHYGFVKKPERLEARFQMSIEKGTKASVGRYERWMDVRWDEDEDIFKSRSIIEEMRPGDGLHIYNGKHPEAVDDHPWRHIKDVREMK